MKTKLFEKIFEIPVANVKSMYTGGGGDVIVANGYSITLKKIQEFVTDKLYQLGIKKTFEPNFFEELIKNSFDSFHAGELIKADEPLLIKIVFLYENDELVIKYKDNGIGFPRLKPGESTKYLSINTEQYQRDTWTTPRLGGQKVGLRLVDYYASEVLGDEKEFFTKNRKKNGCALYFKKSISNMEIDQIVEKNRLDSPSFNQEYDPSTEKMKKAELIEGSESSAIEIGCYQKLLKQEINEIIDDISKRTNHKEVLKIKELRVILNSLDDSLTRDQFNDLLITTKLICGRKRGFFSPKSLKHFNRFLFNNHLSLNSETPTKSLDENNILLKTKLNLLGTITQDVISNLINRKGDVKKKDKLASLQTKYDFLNEHTTEIQDKELMGLVNEIESICSIKRGFFKPKSYIQFQDEMSILKFKSS